MMNHKLMVMGYLFVSDYKRRPLKSVDFWTFLEALVGRNFKYS